MPLLLLLVAQAAALHDTTIEYPGLPKDIDSAVVYVWNDDALPAKTLTVPRTEESLMIRERPGTTVAVAFIRLDGSYRLDGPFVWPDRSLTRTPDAVLRHTVSGTAPAATDTRPPLTWIPAARDEQWPRCRWVSEDRWECWGVPLADSGILVAVDAARVYWRAVQPARVGDWHTADWARLIVVSDSAGMPPPTLQASVQHAVAPPEYRQNGIRLQTAPSPEITVVPLSPGTVWVAGPRSPGQSWVALRAADDAPQIVQLADIADGPLSVPAYLTLDPMRHVQGTVTSGLQPAIRATVTAFRLIDAPANPDDRPKARRVFAEETSTDETGGFVLDGLGTDQYEILAWHPQLGHASAFLDAGQQVVTLHLDQTGIARGRVLVGGKPVAGVDVFSVPDATAFANATDPVDAKGGDGRTDHDGRFVVSVAPSGGGELRIGGGEYSTKRVPLPRTALPLVDVGDIDLGSPLMVQVVLDRDPGCNLLATGPVGRLGLQVVTGVRTAPGFFRVVVPEEGQWQFGLDCTGRIRSLTPTLVLIGQDLNGKDVRLTVPRE